jgi:hypothetical protein
MIALADEIERLQQCEREGWRYAKEVEDEYEKRTGHRFGIAQEPPLAPKERCQLHTSKPHPVCPICNR